MPRRVVVRFVVFNWLLMNFAKIRVLSWNTRGLNDVKKCNVVRNVIRRAICDIVCMQETKWNRFEFVYVSSVLPNFFNRQCVVLDACHLAGGIIIAWKHTYVLINSFTTCHICTAFLR